MVEATLPQLSDLEVQLKESIIKISTPDLYRQNSFQRLSLPTDATLREIAKRQQLIEIGMKTGAPIPSTSGSTLVLDPLSDPFALEETIQRLRIPELRILDEIFWFWPPSLNGGNHSDPGLDFLNQGDRQQAMKFWKMKIAVKNCDEITLHNLAILSHIMVLELEYDRLQKKEDLTNPIQINNQWKECCNYWKKLDETEEFWTRLNNRIRQINDPRLTTGSGRRIRSMITLVIVLTQARLALLFAEAGQLVEASRLIDLIEHFGYESAVVQDAYQATTDTIRKRIKQLCKATTDHAKLDPIHADDFTAELIKANEPLLNIVNLFSGDHRRDREMHDLVVASGQEALIEYRNKTEQLENCLSLLKYLKPIAVSESVKDQVENMISITTQGVVSGDVWCGDGYFDLPADTLHILERARELCNELKWQEAINLLSGLLNTPRSDWTRDQVSLIQTSFAYSLNRFAMDQINKMTKSLNEPRSIITRIQQRYTIAKQQIEYAGWAAQQGYLPQASSQGYLYCMVCGARIYYPQWVVVRIGDLPYVLCQSCNQDDGFEVDARRNDLIKTVRDCGKILVNARQLNPSNNNVRDNLLEIRKIASNLNLVIPPDPRLPPLRKKTNAKDYFGEYPHSQNNVPETKFVDQGDTRPIKVSNPPSKKLAASNKDNSTKRNKSDHGLIVGIVCFSIAIIILVLLVNFVR